MFDKLTAVEASYEALMKQLADPAVQADPSTYRKHAKTLSELEPLVERFRQYKFVTAEIAQTEELVKTADAEMRDLANEELKLLEQRC